MLLTRVSPEGLYKVWDVIRFAVLKAAPEYVRRTPEGMQYIITSLLSGRAQAWLLHDDAGIHTAGITYIESDKLTNDKYLLIYFLYGFSAVDLTAWKQGLDGISKFAKASGCSRIIAYPLLNEVKAFAENFGFSAKEAVMTKEL